jgi:hypothetical protein
MIRTVSAGDILSGVFLTQSQEVAQDIKSRLQLIRNEYYRDLNQGIEWFVDLSKPMDLVKIEGDIKGVVVDTANVISIVEYQTSFDDDRHLTVTMSVNTTFGNVIVEETING